MTDDDEKLKQELERQARRIREAEEDRRTVLSQTVYLGTLGMLLALPIVLGAYLGSWLDQQLGGYSVRWTVGFMLLGVLAGAASCYVFVRSRE